MKKEIILTLLIGIPMMLLGGCKNNKTAAAESMTPAFQSWAPSPPMGWNSWDCYGPTVVEDEVKANADYMSANLKKF